MHNKIDDIYETRNNTQEQIKMGKHFGNLWYPVIYFIVNSCLGLMFNIDILPQTLALV